MITKNKKRELTDLTKITLVDMPLKEVAFLIKGTTPLLMNKPAREVFDPSPDPPKKPPTTFETLTKGIEEKIHYTEDGKICFPARGILKAISECAPYINRTKVNKKLVKGAIEFEKEFVLLQFEKQKINKCPTRTKTGEMVPQWRPEFVGWSMLLEFSFDEKLLSLTEIANLIRFAGRLIGLGSNSPQHSGTNGRFTLL